MRECWYCHAKVASNEVSRCPECRAELAPAGYVEPKPAPEPPPVVAAVTPRAEPVAPAPVPPPEPVVVFARLKDPEAAKVVEAAPSPRLADFAPAKANVAEVAPAAEPALGRKAAALARIAASRPDPPTPAAPTPVVAPARDEESDGVELVPIPAAAKSQTWWADALFGVKHANVFDDVGITTYEVAQEKWVAFGAALPRDPSAIAPVADKRSRIRFDQMDVVSTDFKSAALTISAQGAEHSITLPEEARPAAFEAIKRRTPHLQATKEVAPLLSLACGPSCGLVLIGAIGFPMYMASVQVANEKATPVFTGYRAGRKQALHDLLSVLGPSGTLTIIIALVLACVGRVALRIVARPTIDVLRRSA